MDYRKIIIVGENNIGRSFMAECILRGILQKRNCQNIEVVSRGLVVLFSEPVAPGAAKILREKGYRIEDFRSSQLTDEDLASADLVLAITKGLAEEIKESFVNWDIYRYNRNRRENTGSDGGESGDLSDLL